MSLNKAVDEKTMPQAGIEIYIRDNLKSTRYRIGVIDDPSSEFAGETKDSSYHNLKTKKVVSWNYYNITFKQYEFIPAVLKILKKGLDVFDTYDGTSSVVGKPETFKAWEYGYDDDGSVLLELTWLSSITSVIGSVDWALTDTTDYLVTAFWTSGKSVLSFVTGGNITTLDQDMTIVYDATPIKLSSDKPNATGLPTGFILEIEWNGKDEDWNDMQILNIFDDAKPDQFIETYGGDEDDKWAFNEIKIKARSLDKLLKGFS